MKFVAVLFGAAVALSGARAETPWEHYLALPSAERAGEVNAIEYTPGSLGHNKGHWGPDLDILANQVLAGDEAALRLAFRLTKTTDGGLLGDVLSILGKTTRIYPAEFLREAGDFGLKSSLLRSVLLNPGLEYTDRIQAGAYELAQRRLAMQSVSDPALLPLRNECLTILAGGR
jgi:hypothetical protein